MKYLLGGIVVESDINFTELVQTEMKPDVSVSYGNVPEKLNDVKIKKVLASVNLAGEFLFVAPGIARFLVTSTNEVIIQLIDESRKTDAEKYFFSVVFGVLSYKLGYYPMHGGGIVHEGRAIVFTGRSGIGKSTTLAGLEKRGFSCFGDDISNLFFKDGTIYVQPAFPYLKLWEDSLTFMDKKGNSEYKVRQDMNKYLVPIKNFQFQPVPVKCIYMLADDLQNNYGFETLTGAKKLLGVKNNTYKPWMVDAFNLNRLHFSLLGEIVNNVTFKIYRRPLDKKNISKMLDELIDNI